MAAGSGSRMGGDRPKQFLELGGKAVLQRTIEVFLEAVPGITVVTVLPEQFIDYWKDYCYREKLHLSPDSCQRRYDAFSFCQKCS